MCRPWCSIICDRLPTGGRTFRFNPEATSGTEKIHQRRSGQVTQVQTMPRHCNVAARLTETARQMPDAIGVIEPGRRERDGRRRYARYTFRQLDDDSTQLACGLRELGVEPGTRMALLVKPSFDFISLVFALFKAGAVSILIDPGMGTKNLLACLEESEPEGFVAIPMVQAVRTVLRRRFARVHLNVTVGRRWFWGGATMDQLRAAPRHHDVPAATHADDTAAIIFTTGSTGPPKGVLYRHGNFDQQVDQIREHYDIQPGEIDLACFPLFGLFNCAMGSTTVIPDLDAARPASVDPAKLIETVHDVGVTQSFGSPAIWNKVGHYCNEQQVSMPTLRRVMSAGAPVSPEVLQATRDCIAPDGEVYTPYGATEALPVASIAASEVLSETAARSRQGAGTCVGRRFRGIQWRVIRIVDGPIRSLDACEELPPGEIGELIVHGPVVTREYVDRPQANDLGKIREGSRIWHRMGDVGYLDAEQRFWFCGRMAHRVLTSDGPLYSVPCEAIFNVHPSIYRSALVGLGPRGRQRPVIVAEPISGQMPQTAAEREKLIEGLRQLGQATPLTRGIHDFLVHPSLPVDIRHNAKIFREKLAPWAAAQLGEKSGRYR